MMDPCTPAATSGQEQAALSLTPDVILKLIQNSERSSQGALRERHPLCINVSADDMIEVGSAVVKYLMSSSDTMVERNPIALLSNLKPMLEECFSVGISWFISELMKRNGSQSSVECHQDSLLDEVDEFSNIVKKEVVQEGEGQDHTASDSTDESSDDGVMEEVPDCPTRGDPRFRTKRVPPHILYTVRGVRCQICGILIKASNAVDKLVKHTIEEHPKKATVSFLKQVRQRNAFDKVIGEGIRYCTCKRCQLFGMARFHEGFWQRAGC